MKRIVWLVMVSGLWVVLMVTGCAAAATPVPTLQAELTTVPAPPIVGGATVVDVRLTDSDGQAVTDATVAFDVDMVRMSHGKHVVDAQPGADGHYAAPIQFVMAGLWRVIVNVERPGQAAEKITVELTVANQ